jgi:hypothetical protein
MSQNYMPRNKMKFKQLFGLKIHFLESTNTKARKNITNRIRIRFYFYIYFKVSPNQNKLFNINFCYLFLLSGKSCP